MPEAVSRVKRRPAVAAQVAGQRPGSPARRGSARRPPGSSGRCSASDRRPPTWNMLAPPTSLAVSAAAGLRPSRRSRSAIRAGIAVSANLPGWSTAPRESGRTMWARPPSLADPVVEHDPHARAEQRPDPRRRGGDGPPADRHRDDLDGIPDEPVAAGCRHGRTPRRRCAGFELGQRRRPAPRATARLGTNSSVQFRLQSLPARRELGLDQQHLSSSRAWSIRANSSRLPANSWRKLGGVGISSPASASSPSRQRRAGGRPAR